MVELSFIIVIILSMIIGGIVDNKEVYIPSTPPSRRKR